jgi:predicted transcriptional regulator
MDNDFYSCQGTFNFTQNNGEVSMELKFDDSDNAHCAVYQKGSDILEVLNAFIEDIDSQLAESDDRQADLEEMAKLEAQIKELNSKLDDAYNRYEELQDRTVSAPATPKMMASADEVLRNLHKLEHKKDDKLGGAFFNRYFDDSWFSN